MELYLHSLVCLHGVDRNNVNFQVWWFLSYRMKRVHLLLLLLLCSQPRPGLLSSLLSLGSSTKVVYALLNLPTHAIRATHRPCFARTEIFSGLLALSRYRCKILYSTFLALKPHKLPRLFSISDYSSMSSHSFHTYCTSRPSLI